MQIAVIIQEIRNLPVRQRIYIAEQTLHSIHIEEEDSLLRDAVGVMLKDYQTDEELRVFTQLDCADFYETR